MMLSQWQLHYWNHICNIIKSRSNWPIFILQLNASMVSTMTNSKDVYDDEDDNLVWCFHKSCKILEHIETRNCRYTTFCCFSYHQIQDMESTDMLMNDTRFRQVWCKNKTWNKCFTSVV
jgi:hypothetical protein